MKYKFFDFCSGIGSGRLALEKLSMICVGHSEIDTKAEQTYNLFFNNKSKNYGDLMNINPLDLPDFDFLLAGFPCQAFSIVGNRTGFQHKSGSIIYGLCKILQYKQPSLFLLENVKGLLNHDSGNTLKIILRELTRCGYEVFYKNINSYDFHSPQKRERLYIVGFRKCYNITSFSFPFGFENKTDMKNFLCYNDVIFDKNNVTFQKYLCNKYNKGKYSLDLILQEDFTILDWRQSDLRIYKNQCPTLRTGRHGLLYVRNKQLYKLSSFDAFLMQGYSVKELYVLKNNQLSETVLLSQIGNAMTVTVIKEIVNSMKQTLLNKNSSLLGSQTAKNGFKNEKEIADKFNNWKEDEEAKIWLVIMNYNLQDIESVRAEVIHGYKADINVLIQIKLKDIQDIENIQVKLVSNNKGFNQIDKRYLHNYKKLWDIPDDIYETLEYFTGERLPYKKGTRNVKRMFMDEMFENDRNIKLINWIDNNKIIILHTILKGVGDRFNADWVLVAQKQDNNARWVLKNISTVMQHYFSDGLVRITKLGSIKLGRVTIQRKGGDNGRPTANMLQFKIDPTELFDI